MLRVAVVLFGIVGILLLAVFAVGAQGVSHELKPYPGPGDQRIDVLGGINFMYPRELSGDVSVTIIIDGQRADVMGWVSQCDKTGSGWMTHLQLRPAWVPRMPQAPAGLGLSGIGG